MKTILSFITATLMLLNSIGCIRAQNDDEQIIAMLEEFYKSYITEMISSTPPKLVDEKLDSIKSEYCTTNLLQKVEEQELDYDPFLNAQDSKSECLETLNITIDSIKSNSYIINYYVNILDPSYKKIKEEVTIHVAVIKEEGSYKISDVW